MTPSAYRFQVLSAANDRTWDLQLYYAVDKNGVVCKPPNAFDLASCTEVSMVPAQPHYSYSALPLCTINPDTGPTGLGLAIAVLDGSGNPLNGTGLQANCWPTTWPTDGRDGGVPDPTTAGPPIIQIGTEGGLLPAPVVIPSTPVGFEYNRRSITVLNVGIHGLLMGPAERADIVVDFSGVPTGSVLMLYNDAPAPVPAGDPRIDYYTGDPDNSPTGGAPSTQPGYGPNTRTIMQIKVDGSNPNTVPFSLPALTTQLPGIFASSQDQIIVKESAYPLANGGGSDTYARIQDNYMVLGASPIANIAVTNGGSLYTSPPAVSFVGGTPTTPAMAQAIVGGSPLKSVTVVNQGVGYKSRPNVTFTGGGGTGAAATATVTGGKVTAVTLTNPGSRVYL